MPRNETAQEIRTIYLLALNVFFKMTRIAPFRIRFRRQEHLVD